MQRSFCILNGVVISELSEFCITMRLRVCVYIYIYMYAHVCIYVSAYIYIHMYPYTRASAGGFATLCSWGLSKFWWLLKTHEFSCREPQMS